jgi:hypothetical protein
MTKSPKVLKKSPRKIKKSPRKIKKNVAKMIATTCTIKGGKRTEAEKLRPKCDGEVDPIGLGEIEPKFAIRLLDNGKNFCFDIRSLVMWFNTSGKITNPMTQTNFGEVQKEKIKKKVQKLLDEGLDVPKLNKNIERTRWEIRMYDFTESLVNLFQNQGTVKDLDDLEEDFDEEYNPISKWPYEGNDEDIIETFGAEFSAFDLACFYNNFEIIENLLNDNMTAENFEHTRPYEAQTEYQKSVLAKMLTKMSQEQRNRYKQKLHQLLSQIHIDNHLKQNIVSIVDRSTMINQEKESFRHVIFPPLDPSAHGVGMKRRRED